MTDNLIDDLREWREDALCACTTDPPRAGPELLDAFDKVLGWTGSDHVEVSESLVQYREPLIALADEGDARAAELLDAFDRVLGFLGAKKPGERGWAPPYSLAVEAVRRYQAAHPICKEQCPADLGLYWDLGDYPSARFRRHLRERRLPGQPKEVNSYGDLLHHEDLEDWG